MPAAKAFVGVTDGDWFRLLASQTHLEEVNFWQPGGNRVFSALSPGELFLFKLHSRDGGAIVGGGFFTHSTLLPVSLAWQAFEKGNGAISLMEMRNRIERYRREISKPHEDYTVGCILLSQPFFLKREDWIDEPPDWHPNIVQGKTYSSDSVHGRQLIERIERILPLHEARARSVNGAAGSRANEEKERYGSPMLVKPRLGQGSFRIVVTDAYSRRCALSGERVLPVLEAAHIRPFGQGGAHEVRNGLLLRSDLHTLFDRGYITITPRHDVEVSKRIHDEYENGREYYALHGRKILLPRRSAEIPADDNLRWHNENIFAG
ncbi:MAG: HNH endonuclease [Candidatus Latescibacterota bacterium]|jgi:putative restriction endonuclease|nr:MAG: HNH endonuclease [Candidatus Latescibacterota bacterium]